MTAEQRREERVAPENEESEESTDGVNDADTDHLSDVPDGSGCTEIWEHLSEARDDDE